VKEMSEVPFEKMTPEERERAMEQAVLDIEKVRIKAEELVQNLRDFEHGFKRVRSKPQ